MADYFTEIFPIPKTAIPPLTVYHLDIDTVAGIYNTIGGKLSYALQREFRGDWCYSQGYVLTSTQLSDEKLQAAVSRIRAADSATYRALRMVTRSTWQANAEAQAEFIVRKLNYLVGKAETELGEITITNAVVQRELELRAWDIAGSPAISISVSTALTYKEDLAGFLKRISDVTKVKDLRVRAKNTSSLKGKIIKISGTAVERRSILLSYNPTEASKHFIMNAPDNEPVFWVESQARTPYEYVASQLNVIVEPAQYRLLGINGKEARQATTLDPEVRSKLIRRASDIFKKQGYIDNAYISRTQATHFLSASDIAYRNKVQIGNGVVVPHSPASLVNDIIEHGMFERGHVPDSVTIGVLFVEHQSKLPPNQFWTQLKTRLGELGVKVNSSVPTETVEQPKTFAMEQAISKLIKQEVNFILSIFPKVNLDADIDDGVDWEPYIELKRHLVSKQIPNQVISSKTLENDDAVDNVALGIISKLGAIPYALETPLPYADAIVGLDIARERKQKLQGSRSAAASLQIYQNDGRFLGYRLPDMQLDGETIPPDMLRFLFPSDLFADKRVVVHRDGYLRGDEKETLLRWGEDIGAKFLLVEILKKTPPRLYSLDNSKVGKPTKGTAFLINNSEAIVVSSPPPFGKATPRPIRIRSHSPFDIKEALHSVLSLTLMHHGSLLPPRLPISIHHSDKIAYLAIRNIKPKEANGHEQYWL